MAFQDLPLSVQCVLLQALRKPRSPAPFKFFEPFWVFPWVHILVFRNNWGVPSASPFFFHPWQSFKDLCYPLELGRISFSPQFSKSSISCLASLFFYFGLESAIWRKLGYCGVMRRWVGRHTPWILVLGTRSRQISLSLKPAWSIKQVLEQLKYTEKPCLEKSKNK